MKEEEIRPIVENYVEEYCHLPDGEYTDGSLVCSGIGTALIVSRQLEKRIAELEAQVSVLLSCKNCPDNKGGLLCQKEYEDKCLAQKIQYIKELKEELEEEKKLNAKNERLALVDRVNELEKLTIAVDEDRDNAQKRINEYILTICNKDKQLTEAKEIIRDLLSCLYSVEYDCVSDLEEAEQFLKECEE